MSLFRSPVICAALARLIALVAALAAPLSAVAAWTPIGLGLEALNVGGHPTSLAQPGTGSTAAAAASAPRVLVVADESPAGLRFVDPDAGTELGTVALSGRPVALAVDSAGSRAYALTNDDRLHVVALATRTLVSSFSLAGNPKALLLYEKNGQVAEVIIALKGPDRLIGLHPGSGALLHSVPLEREPPALAGTTGGTHVIAGIRDGRLFAFDASTLALVSSAQLGDEIRRVLWWEAGGVALAVHKRPDGVSLVNVATGLVTAFFALEGEGEQAVVDAASGHAYLGTHFDFSINRIDLVRGVVDGRYALPEKAAGMIFDAFARKLIVSQRGDGRLLRIDPAQATLLSLLTLAKRPRDVAVNNVTHEAVAVADKADELTRIKLSDHTAAIVALTARPRFVAVDSALNLAVVGLKNRDVRFVDLAPAAGPALLPERVILPDEPEALAVDASRNLTVALTDSKRAVHFIANTTRTLLSSVVVGEDTEALAIHAGRGLAYVLTEKRNLLLVNLDTRSIVQTITLEFRGSAIALSEPLDRAVITTEDGNKAYVLDLATLNAGTSALTAASFAQVHLLPRKPGAVAIQQDSGLAVVASRESNALSAIDLNTGTLSAAFATLEKPFALAVTSRYNQALALLGERDDVAFVQLPNPVPVLETVTPNEAPVGSAPMTVTLTGKRFIEASRVFFGTTMLATRWLSHTRLEADIPSNLLASAATVNVTVETPLPAGGTSSALAFTVVPPPVLNAITPNTAPADGQPKALTLTGQNFRSGATVLFGGAALPATVISATSLSVTVPGSLATTPGVVQVSVVDRLGHASSNLSFTLTPPLGISSFTPTSGPVGTAVAISGAGFDPNLSANQIKFNGEPAVIVSGGATTLNVIVPPRATTGPITITNARGTAASATAFTVQEREAFDITLAPASIQVPPGGLGGTRIRLASTGLNPYPYAANIAITGLPTGITATLDRPTVALNQDAIVTFNAAAGATSGGFTVTLTATGASGVRTQTVTKTLGVQVLAAGGTTVTGRVLHADDGAPFVGARVRLATAAVFTDESGTYRFVNPPVLGDQVLLIDGNTNNNAQFEFPSGIAMPVMIVAGQDNKVLTSFIGRVDATKFTSVVPGQAATVTDADVPNFSLNIQSGQTITGWDGQPVTKINVRKVPVDRLPIRPIPEGVETRTVYLFYFFREGGGDPSSPIPVTIANDIEALPGEQVTLYYYDESRTPDPSSNQWRVMGMGTVSEDGKTIVSNAGVGIPRFCCGATFGGRTGGGNTGGLGGNGGCPNCPGSPQQPQTYNPVDLASGNALVFRPRPFGLSIISAINANLQYRSTDPRQGLFGRGFSFTYDWFAEAVSSTAVRVTNPGGVQFILSREADGIYRSRAGRSGAIEMEITATATGRTLRIADGTRYEFNAPGRLQAITDVAGNRTTFEVDALGFPFSITDPTGKVYEFTLSGGGASTRINRITDPQGRYIEFTYDAGRNLSSYRDQGGGVTQFGYGAGSRITQVTDPRLAVKTIEYDGAGRAIREVLPENVEERYAYTAVGTTVAETRHTDANGNVTTYRFNGLGYLTEKIDAVGRKTRYELDPVTNFLRRMTDPAGRVTQYFYNARGDLIRTVDADNKQTLIDYDPRFRKPTRIENALGHVTTMAYDAQGNMTSITNAELETSTFTYNSRGQVETITDPLGRVTRFAYDVQGNLANTTNPANETVTRIYDSANRMVELTDSLNRTTRFTYDALDRMTQVQDAALGLTKYAYDANDNLLSVTDPNNNPVERNVYDLRNRLKQKTDAKSLSVTYDYDGVGNLIRITDRKLQITAYAYDALNRLTRIQDHDGRVTTYAYDLAGNLAQISDTQSGDILMSYDVLNRLTEVVTPQGTVAYAYDAIGRRTSRTLSGADVTTYTYDKTDRVKTVTLRGRTATYTYDFAGRLTQKVLPDGIKAAYQYDDADRVISISYKKTDESPIETVNYGYDDAGQRSSRGDGQVPPKDTTFSATYDEANRLTAITLGGEAFTLSYDANGNLASKSGPTSGTTTYTWNARDQLVALSGPSGSATFKYDALGRRIEKTVNGASTGFLYDGAQAVAELKGSALDILYHTGLLIDEVLARYGASGNRSLLSDALMSVIAQANDDQTIANFYAYSGYGEATALGPDGGNSLQYTGRENDGTGLYYYRARYYDPVLKRFISEDPSGLDGGVNLFAYAAGDPISFADPEGLQRVTPRRPKREIERHPEAPDPRTAPCLGILCLYERVCLRWRCEICPGQFFNFPDQSVISPPGWSPANDPKCSCIQYGRLRYQ